MLDESLVHNGVIKLTRPIDSLGERLLRKIVLAALSRVKQGRLHVQWSGGSAAYGCRDSCCDFDVTLYIRDSRAWRAIALGGTVGAGESYTKGWWNTSDLPALVRLLLVNEDSMNTMDFGWGRVFSPLNKLFHLMRRNSRTGSRRNIAAHYDLGNDFYRLWLDDTMCYSSGIFEHAEATLGDASTAKMDRICRKLNLARGDRLVEIGTGWGGFAIHAATQYGCRVTTTTISRQQFEFVRDRVRAAGLESLITVLNEDYRDLHGTFEKLTSIEMIEAIGWRQFDVFFRKCASLMTPNGRACIQAITIADRYYEAAKRDVDFIKRHIFPGCCIPSIAAMTAAIARASDLTPVHLEQFGGHYERTLRMWRESLFGRIEEVRALGLDDDFIRMWEFYLAYCEGAFAERRTDVVQLTLNKPQCVDRAILPQRSGLTTG